MDNQWKCEKCETCNFVVEWAEDGREIGLLEGERITDNIPFGQCRKNPPTISTMTPHRFVERYPIVHKYTSACSCWREK